MPAQETQRITDLVLQLWNTGNTDIANQLYTAHSERHDPNGPEAARGPQQIVKYLTQVRTAFPDFKLEINQRIVEGDHIVSHWTCTGTQNGEYQGLPPTGKRVELSGMTLAHIKDGKITSERVYFDRLSLLQQLGVAPKMQAAAHATS